MGPLSAAAQDSFLAKLRYTISLCHYNISLTDKDMIYYALAIFTVRPLDDITNDFKRHIDYHNGRTVTPVFALAIWRTIESCLTYCPPWVRGEAFTYSKEMSIFAARRKFDERDRGFTKFVALGMFLFLCPRRYIVALGFLESGTCQRSEAEREVLSTQVALYKFPEGSTMDKGKWVSAYLNDMGMLWPRPN